MEMRTFQISPGNSNAACRSWQLGTTGSVVLQVIPFCSVLPNMVYTITCGHGAHEMQLI